MKNERIDRRRFIRNTSSVMFTGAILPVLPTDMAKSESKEDSFGFLTLPYLQNLNHDMVVVMFIINSNAHSWVEFGENGFDNIACSSRDGLVDADIRLNKMILKNLKPETTYFYRVVSKQILSFDPYDLKYGEKITSEAFSFTTPKKDSGSVSCVILNDIHDRPDSFYDLFGLAEQLKFDFVVLNGDMFDYQTDERQIIDHLLVPCTNLFATETPFLMIRGNHETRGKYARQLKGYFTYPDHDEYYFSFRQGPVHFIVLDSGEDKEDEHPEYGGIVNFDEFREEQARWLENEVSKSEFSDCKYKVVIMHIPPFYSGNGHGTMHCRKLFHPVFERHNIAMVISGHTHAYGIHPPTTEHSYPIIIGGGPQKGNRTLIHLKANFENLETEMIKDDGSIIGRYTV